MNDMLRRFFQAAECKTQMELAAFLGIRQSSVSDAKRREVIPAEWLVTLMRQKNTHPDWVLSGIGPRFLLPVESPDDQLMPAPEREKGNALARFSMLELAAEMMKRGTQLIEGGLCTSIPAHKAATSGLSCEQVVAGDRLVELEQALRCVFAFAIAELKCKGRTHCDGGSVEVHI